MIRIMDIEKVFKSLTIEELKEIKNNLFKFLDERNLIKKNYIYERNLLKQNYIYVKEEKTFDEIVSYEFLKEVSGERYTKKDVGYFIKKGIFDYGFDVIIEILDNIIKEKSYEKKGMLQK